MEHNFTNIKTLIITYQKAVFELVSSFYEKYKRKDLMAASRDGTFPRSGFISKRCHYSFHGAGLGANIGEIRIDFDFGPNNSINGFDAWRLYKFIEHQKEIYPAFTNQAQIQKELDKLEKIEFIHKPKLHPGTANYYWKDSFYSLKIENLKKASKGKKRKLIEIDIFNYTLKFLLGKIDLNNLKIGLKILSEPKIIPHEEMVSYIKSFAKYEGFQMAHGKEMKERELIKKRVNALSLLSLK